MRNWLFWLGVTLAIAAAVHVGSVYLVPSAIMRLATARMGDVNAIHHGKRVDAESRGVVRPSPDLLYSTCPFDLSDGPVHVTAPVPPATYWSVSVFDADTNNFYVRNDRQIRRSVDFYLARKGKAAGIPAGARIVTSPTARGLVLFRTLIADEDRFAEIDAARRQATCASLASSHTRSGG